MTLNHLQDDESFENVGRKGGHILKSSLDIYAPASVVKLRYSCQLLNDGSQNNGEVYEGRLVLNASLLFGRHKGTLRRFI